MSNNIIDTVTQAVNSLVSALKLPDESAKANDTLGSMNFPQFSRILPYKDYDSATGLFINNKTVGFMFEARPLPGADKSIVATLEHLLRSKLPRGVPVSFHLVSSKLVGNDIDYGLREFRWSGKQAKKFNAITRAYYLRAAETQFPLPDNLDLPLTLRNYRVYISCCVPRKKNSTTQIVELENQIKVLPVIVALVLFALATSAFLSRVVLEYSTPRVVAFDMKKTLDSFMDSVSQKQLTEAQSKALSDRFNDALEKSLAEYQQQHHVVILVSPAVVQGAPDVTRNIQHDIARRMKGEQ
ncbi:TPA: type-F conjugative transfer system protein TrbI [Klebsiella pneumoniae]